MNSVTELKTCMIAHNNIFTADRDALLHRQDLTMQHHILTERLTESKPIPAIIQRYNHKHH